jgi:hypothetical protein
MIMESIEYRQQFEPFIEKGLQKWQDLGFEITEELKLKILENWQNGNHIFDHSTIRQLNKFIESKRDVIIASQTEDENIHELKNEMIRILSLFPRIDQDSLSYYERDKKLNFSTILTDFLYLFGIFIGSRVLLSQPLMQQWVSEKESYCIEVLSNLFAIEAKDNNWFDEIKSIILKMSPPRGVTCVLLGLSQLETNYKKQIRQLCLIVFKKNELAFNKLDSFCNEYVSNLLEYINSPFILVYIANTISNKWDIEDVFQRFVHVCRANYSQLQYWDLFLPSVKKFPYGILDCPNFVGGRIPEYFWESGHDEKKKFALNQYISLLNADFEFYLEKIKQCILDNPTLSKECLSKGEFGIYERHIKDLKPRILIKLFDSKIVLLDRFIPSIIDCKCNPYGGSKIRSFHPYFKRIISEQPESLLKINAKFIPLYLKTTLLTDDDFTNLSEILKPIAGRSKIVRNFLKKLFQKNLSLELLEKHNWIKDRKKAVRDFSIDVILNHKDPPINVLKKVYVEKKLSYDQKMEIHQLLKTKGVEISSDQKDEIETDLKTLLKQAKSITIRKKKIFNDLWDEGFLNYLKPLDRNAARWLMILLDETKESQNTLPELAKILLSHVKESNRQKFCHEITKRWLACNADKKYKWIINLIAFSSDDLLVTPLFDAVKKWRKGTDQLRAIRCIHALNAQGNQYALGCIFEIFSKRNFNENLQAEASKALGKAAKKQKISRLDLYDQLIPDFGLTEVGLTLDVGVRSYLVTVFGDLSLRVLNKETGRITKSMPKARKDEDPEKRIIAENKYKYLSRNIKKVAKQQAERMEEAVILQRKWSYRQWKKLFLEHPLLSIMSQAYIWQYGSKKKNTLSSFRISEDKSLIDVEDQEQTFKASDKIWLWHPVNATDEERHAWIEHMQDYNLSSNIQQLTLPCHQLTPEELNNTELNRFADTCIIRCK